MNTDRMIEVTGSKLTDIAKAAYDLSYPMGMGFLHYEEGSLTDEEAEYLITDGKNIPLSMDYVKGRACKLTVFKDGDKLYIDESWYDHSDEQLQNLLSRIEPE